MTTGQPLVGRLAPSPTGAQHLGNARTYLLAWLSIRARGGRVILRIEDIDSPRIKPGAAEQALDDLHWLGLDWDEGPDVGGAEAPYVQTERIEYYVRAWQQLCAAERVYPCSCTRSDVQAAASAPHVGQEGPIYPGTCQERLVVAAGGIEAPVSWRLRTTPDDCELQDAFLGRQTCRVAAELGDFVVFRQHDLPAYQLAVVVDDHMMGVTEVLRGDDLLPSAFRQCQLYDFFGWTRPRFVHVPLLVGPDGRRLAKRHGDTRLATLRDEGVAAADVVGWLAYASGLRDRNRPTTPRELLADFDQRRVPRQPLVVDEGVVGQLRAASQQ